MAGKALIEDGFTIIWPYYENPGQLLRQIQVLNCYSKSARQKIKVIVVDDGSPRNPALPVLQENSCPVEIRLFRIKQNIPWNNHGARNLGAKAAGPGWLFMTDIDHLLMPKEADKLLAKTIYSHHFYTFERVSLPDMSPYHYHCNSFIVDRTAYWNAGGYDEDFCGSYGGDGVFLRALASLTPRLHLKDISIVRVPREVQPDASTVEWPRVGYYKELYRYRLREKNKLGLVKAKNPLRFEWERQL